MLSSKDIIHWMRTDISRNVTNEWRVDLLVYKCSLSTRNSCLYMLLHSAIITVNMTATAEFNLLNKGIHSTHICACAVWIYNKNNLKISKFQRKQLWRTVLQVRQAKPVRPKRTPKRLKMKEMKKNSVHNWLPNWK